MLSLVYITKKLDTWLHVVFANTCRCFMIHAAGVAGASVHVTGVSGHCYWLKLFNPHFLLMHIQCTLYQILMIVLCIKDDSWRNAKSVSTEWKFHTGFYTDNSNTLSA